MEPLGKKFNSIDVLVKSYIILLTVLLFAAFPVALFIPTGYGFNVFNFFLPAFLLASGFSAAMLLMLRKTGQKAGFIEYCSLLIFVSFLIATLVNGASGAEFLKYCGLALVPVSVALAYRVLPDFFLKVFSTGAFFLWLVNIVHCYHKFPHLNEVGIAGNRNWLSALVLATSFLTVKVLKDFAGKRLKNEKAAWALAIGVTALLSIPLIVKADSRASYTAMAALPVFVFFLLGSRKVRLLTGVTVLVASIAVPLVFKEAVLRENKRNIRVPMWSSTIRMILENPLGAGPENFENKFPAYVSRKQKEMLVSAVTSTHPHNEFLHICATGGIAAGISWLLMAGFALFYRMKNREDLFLVLPLFILFVQGMMDKPLYQMPTMLLFYVLLGLVLGRKELLNVEFKKPVREKLGLYKAVAALILLAYSYFAVVTALSSWFEREALTAEQAGQKEKALHYFSKSSALASWRLFPAYKAFLISTVDIPDPVKAAVFYEIIEQRAPDLRQFNLLKGKFFTQLAMQDRSNAGEHLENAWRSYQRACDLNVSDILSFVDRLKFALRFGQLKQVEESYKSLVDLYNFKAERSAEELRVDLKDWGRQWQQNKKFSEFLQSSVELMNFFKIPLVESEYFPTEFNSLLPTFSGNYSIADMVYATDAYLLMSEAPEGDFPAKVKMLLESVRTSAGKAFSLPRQVLREKTGSRLSKLCLLAMMARNHGFDSFIDTEANTVFLLKEAKFFLIDETGFKELSGPEAGEYVKGRQFSYFEYPQGFFYKNEVLAYTLYKAGATALYCRNPDYVIPGFLKRFAGSGASVKILAEPFQDILNKMKGGPQ